MLDFWHDMDAMMPHAPSLSHRIQMPYPAKIDMTTLGASALELVERQGWDAWSWREMARALGVSANALYRHVDGKRELDLIIAEAAVKALTQELLQCQQQGMAGAIEIARSYVTFAIERPHAYAAFVHAKPEPSVPRTQAWTKLWEHVRARFDTTHPSAAAAAAFAFWALVHGRAELARGPAREVDPLGGLDDAVRALFLGFMALGEVPSPMPPHTPSHPPE